MAFLNVIGSLRNKAESNIVRMGVKVTTMAASIGLIYSKPLTNSIWFIRMPNMAAKNRRIRSRGGTRSHLTKAEAIQNSSIAPIVRKKAIANASM